MNVQARDTIALANENVAAFFSDIPDESEREKYIAEKVAALKGHFGGVFALEDEQLSANMPLQEEISEDPASNSDPTMDPTDTIALANENVPAFFSDIPDESERETN